VAILKPQRRSNAATGHEFFAVLSNLGAFERHCAGGA
jgi:hypothetical protein